MDITVGVLVGLLVIAIGLGVMLLLRWRRHTDEMVLAAATARRVLAEAEASRQELLRAAEEERTTLRAEAEAEAAKRRLELEAELGEKRTELEAEEARLRQQEETLERQLAALEQRDRALTEREQQDEERRRAYLERFEALVQAQLRAVAFAEEAAAVARESEGERARLVEEVSRLRGEAQALDEEIDRLRHETQSLSDRAQALREEGERRRAEAWRIASEAREWAERIAARAREAMDTVVALTNQQFAALHLDDSRAVDAEPDEAAAQEQPGFLDEDTEGASDEPERPAPQRTLDLAVVDAAVDDALERMAGEGSLAAGEGIGEAGPVEQPTRPVPDGTAGESPSTTDLGEAVRSYGGADPMAGAERSGSTVATTRVRIHPLLLESRRGDFQRILERLQGVRAVTPGAVVEDAFDLLVVHDFDTSLLGTLLDFPDMTFRLLAQGDGYLELRLLERAPDPTS